jgi:hypothetical protein
MDLYFFLVVPIVTEKGQDLGHPSHKENAQC